MKKRYSFFSKNWRGFGLSVALAVLFYTCSSAQNGPAKQWDKTFGGSSAEQLLFLQQTTDGGYISGGRSNSGIGGDKTQPSLGSDDFWIVRQDVNGNKIWDKTIGGSGPERINSLQQTADGGYILGGYSSSGISGDKTQASRGNRDFWVVKVDGSGNKVWDKTFGGSGADDLFIVNQTTDGGYILGGYSTSPLSGEKSQASKGSDDFWIVKIDGLGNKQWDKTIGGSGSDFLWSLQQTSDGGFILGGASTSGLSGDKTQITKGLNDFWLVKLDGLGNKLWDKSFGGSGDDHLYFLQQSSTGGFILGGESNSGISGDKTQASQGQMDFWIVKVDAAGNKIWDKAFGGAMNDVLYSLDQTADGGYILGGLSASGTSADKSQANLGSQDFWVVKVDSNGNKVWDKTLGGSDNDVLVSLQQTSDNGYVFGGFSSTSISADKSQPTQGGVDFWIVKLGPDILGIKDNETGFEASLSPNPSQGKFNLQINNISVPKVKVSVSDLLGREILQKELPVVNKQVSENLEMKTAKGLYLLQIKAGNKTTTRKIVVE